MKYIKNLLWIIALILVSFYGLTLSYSLLSVSAVCVAVAGFSIAVSCYKEGANLRRLDFLMAFAIAYFIWRIFTSPVWDLAKEDLMLLASGLITYLFFRLGGRSGLARTAIVVLSVSVVANGIAYLVQQSGGNAYLPLYLVDSASAQTPSFGLFQDYGALGNAMAVIGMVLCSFGVAARSAGVKTRSLVGVLGALALALALFSGSRSAALSVVVAGVLMVVVLWLRAAALEPSARKRLQVMIFVGACCAGGVVTVFALKTFVERDGKVLQTGVATEQNVRQGYWGMALDQSAEVPILGSGARAYSYKSNTYWQGAMGSRDASPEFVHNEYLQVLGEYGCVGLLLLMILLGVHWFLALKSLLLEDSSFEENWMCLAGLLGLTVVMVHSFTDFALRLPFNMMLAAICLGWCTSLRRKRDKCGEFRVQCSGLGDGAGEVETKERRGGRIKDKGLAVVLLLFSAGVAVFAGKEVWAASPLLLEKQAREGRAWSPERHEGFLEAYELADERSPDFRRSQRIGQVYHLAYEKGDETAFVKAEKFYMESLMRHPYNPVTLLNLANLYRDAEMYTKAEIYYDRAEPYVAARDWHFKYYIHRARLEIGKGERAYTDGEFDIAEQHLVEAAEMVMLGNSEFKPRVNLLRDCHVARVRIAVEIGNYDEAASLWKKARKQVPSRILNQKGAMAYHALGGAYFAAAVVEWKSRNPELAKVLFQKTQKFYNQDKGIRKQQEDELRDENLAFALKALKILEEGGF